MISVVGSISPTATPGKSLYISHTRSPTKVSRSHRLRTTLTAVPRVDWGHILPKFEAIIRERRKRRVIERRASEKANRRNFVQRSIARLITKELDVAPYCVEPRDAMARMFKEALPSLDILPLARKYVKGRMKQVPSRERVSLESEERAREHMLRTRALLVRLLDATNLARETADSADRDVPTSAATIKELEAEVRAMTLEDVLQNDPRNRQVLFHPAAIFVPKKTSKSIASGRIGLPSHIHNTISYHPASGSDALFSSTWFYPSVFRLFPRPQNTSPNFRDLYVHAALSNAAVRILQHNFEPLDPMSIMHLALTDAQVFLCDYCVVEQNTSHSKANNLNLKMNWIQIVSTMISQTTKISLRCPAFGSVKLAHYDDIEGGRSNPVQEPKSFLRNYCHQDSVSLRAQHVAHPKVIIRAQTPNSKASDHYQSSPFFPAQEPASSSIPVISFPNLYHFFSQI